MNDLDELVTIDLQTTMSTLEHLGRQGKKKKWGVVRVKAVPMI